MIKKKDTNKEINESMLDSMKICEFAHNSDINTNKLSFTLAISLICSCLSDGEKKTDVMSGISSLWDYFEEEKDKASL